MKKEHIHKFLYTVSLFLIIGFAVRLGTDYYKYDEANNSAPFYVLVIERAVEFILPSVIVFISGKIVKKKHSASPKSPTADE